MSKILTINTSPLQTNTYIVINGERGFVVDPGGSANEIAKIFDKENAKIEAILLTHAHFDHIAGVKALQDVAKDRGDNAMILLHKDELEKVATFRNMGFAVGVKVEKFTPDILLNGGENINICGLEVRVIHTPGHSKGGVCYIVEDNIFSGDTLFKLSYGRTDFYDGSFKELKNSVLNKLFAIKGDYKVYSGHSDVTTLEDERRFNPIRQDGDTIRIID